MIWAAYGGRTETVELLILKNADVNAKSISNLRVDGEKDWEKLLTDVLVLGNIQIPWMLIMGVILEIFGFGWGGAIVLICAILIIFLGPRKYEWKVAQ